MPNIQTSEIQTGEIETVASRAARKAKEATNPSLTMAGQRVGTDRFDTPNADFNVQKSDIAPKGGLPDGIQFYWQDGTTTFVESSTILENKGSNTDWSVDLDVSGLAATKTITYSNATALYDNTGSNQTAARIPIYRDDKFVATYGAYQEGLRCVNGEPVVEFYKI